jgi:hypothetical protein
MKHHKKAAALLAALIVSVVLAACGSESESSDVVSGQFEPVPGVPTDYQGVAGEASLERSDGATTVSLQATGLEPKTAYEAHLHSQGCNQSDPGGPHFKFDPSGGDEPPNEIHLEFSTNAAGAGNATATSKRDVPVGEAGSVVIHEAGDEHMTAAASGGAEALFVHEGHHHDEGGEQAESAPIKVACAELEGGGGSSAASPTVVVKNGEPVGGVQELEFSAGERVRFNVKSDVADEIHVHGYDLMQDVPAGGEISFDFPAEIEGIFEVELEGRKEQIAELRVNP